jgi:hypothetical protein
LNWAIARHDIPRPPGTVGQQYVVRFSVDEWSPFVSLGSVFDQGASVNAGFAVDDWRPNHFETGTDVATNKAVDNIFTGVNADLAVNDTDAWIYRLGYNITLTGRIVFIAPPVPDKGSAGPKSDLPSRVALPPGWLQAPEVKANAGQAESEADSGDADMHRGDGTRTLGHRPRRSPGTTRLPAAGRGVHTGADGPRHGARSSESAMATCTARRAHA